MKTKLSVNINKIATLRNSRGGNTPDVIKVAMDCERYGADGITVHPRPDERHIRYTDVYALAKVVKGEFNIEGNPKEQKFVDLVLEVKPTQVTLVPDVAGQLTSNHGWDTVTNKSYLIDTVNIFKAAGIRTSIFVDPELEMIRGAKEVGTERVELYTESYAKGFLTDKQSAVASFKSAAEEALKLNIGLNAGHDLNLDNLNYFTAEVVSVLEVSIGHALVSDALYLGLENTVQLYQRALGTNY